MRKITEMRAGGEEVIVNAVFAGMEAYK